MISDLVRIHHEDYQDDIPFWTRILEDRDPILEVGCGHGRVTVPLLLSGHEVTGVDIDHQAIRYLREFLEERDQELQNRAQIIHLDIIDFHPQGQFGAVIIPCNTYSTFPPDKRRVLLSGVSKMLKPGGVVAVSMPNPIHIRRFIDDLKDNDDQFGSELETTISHPETGFPVQVSSSLYAREDRLVWDWIYDHLLPDGQVIREIQSTEHYPTIQDIYINELNENGYDGIRSLGDYDESPFTEDSPYLILLGQKLVI